MIVTMIILKFGGIIKYYIVKIANIKMLEIIH
jgi:hypothetical protein